MFVALCQLVDLSMHSQTEVSEVWNILALRQDLHASWVMWFLGIAIARHKDSSKATASCCGHDKSQCLSVASGQSQMHPVLMRLPLAAAVRLQAGP